jgi:hypothetical protein
MILVAGSSGWNTLNLTYAHPSYGPEAFQYNWLDGYSYFVKKLQSLLIVIATNKRKSLYLRSPLAFHRQLLNSGQERRIDIDRKARSPSQNEQMPTFLLSCITDEAVLLLCSSSPIIVQYGHKLTYLVGMLYGADDNRSINGLANVIPVIVGIWLFPNHMRAPCDRN